MEEVGEKPVHAFKVDVPANNHELTLAWRLVHGYYRVSPLLIAAQYSFPFQPSMMTTLLSSLSTAFLLHLTSFVSTLFDLSHFITMAAREQLVSSDCSVQLKNSCFLANNDLCKVQRIQCRWIGWILIRRWKLINIGWNRIRLDKMGDKG